MYHLPLTLETPAENLALDEALLEAAEAGEMPGEALRLWEPAAPFVVLGRSSPITEVRFPIKAPGSAGGQNDARHPSASPPADPGAFMNPSDCVPVLRRCSGGATVVAGPGCLMYAVMLDLRARPEARGVDRAHAFVLGKTAAALARLAPGAACDGTSDLTLPTVGGVPRRKFSGNSLRVRRNHLLYHGAILYDFPLEQITRWLAMPAREPCYRAARSHEDFLTNFPARRDEIAASLVEAWQANEPLAEWPRERTQQLAATRYASLDWSAPRSAPATC